MLECALLDAQDVNARTNLSIALVVLVTACTGNTGDDVGLAGDAGASGGDGSGDPLADAGAPDAQPPDVIACTATPTGTLALELTYDAPANITGGTLELQGSQTWSLTQPTGSGRIGVRGVRSELRYGDPEAYGGPRAETAVVGASASRYAAGDSFFYGFSVNIPAGWVDDSGNEDILFQWHNIPDFSAGEAAKSPNLFLAIKRDEFVLRITSDANPVSTSTSPLKEQALLVDGLDFTQATWHDFVFHVVWSYQGTAGLVEVWHKTASATGYRKVLEKVGPNMHNDTLKGYVKWGIYKPSWRTGPTAATARIVMHDEVRVGKSFGIVEPACP
jgi:hypothetical protein